MKTKNYYICEAVRGSSKFYFMEGKMNDKGKKNKISDENETAFEFLETEKFKIVKISM